MLKAPKRIIICEKDSARRAFIQTHYPDVLVCEPEDCKAFVRTHSDHGGCARPNATVMVVAFYDEPQTIPLPEMYGKNLIFKTGGVDGCDCAEILQLIAQGKIDTTPLIASR